MEGRASSHFRSPLEQAFSQTQTHTHTHTCRRASHRPTLINVRLSVFNLFTSGLCGRQVLRSRPCVIHLKPLQHDQDSGGVIENIGADLNAGIENEKIFGVIVAQAECPLEHCQR